MAAGLPACSALADAFRGVFSDEGGRDGRSGRPRGVALDPPLRWLATDDAEGDDGGEEPGDGVEVASRALLARDPLRLRDGLPVDDEPRADVGITGPTSQGRAGQAEARPFLLRAPSESLRFRQDFQTSTSGTT